MTILRLIEHCKQLLEEKQENLCVRVLHTLCHMATNTKFICRDQVNCLFHIFTRTNCKIGICREFTTYINYIFYYSRHWKWDNIYCNVTLETKVNDVVQNLVRLLKNKKGNHLHQTVEIFLLFFHYNNYDNQIIFLEKIQ